MEKRSDADNDVSRMERKKRKIKKKEKKEREGQVMARKKRERK
jgi:hypothetical protein